MSATVEKDTHSSVKRILITGSRSWPKPAWVEEAIVDYMTENFSEDVNFVIVHGAAAGADQFSVVAQRRLKDAGWPVSQERHPAEWEKHGRKAGFLRNSHMVNLGADICLAFIHNESKGATMCADLARAKSIPVRYFKIEG